MKEIALAVINNYGVEHQQRKLQEEVFELQEAITTYELKESVEYDIPLSELVGSREHIIEELGDVRFMLLQFQAKYDIKDEEIEEVMLFKGNRQTGRIKYENNRNFE